MTKFKEYFELKYYQLKKEKIIITKSQRELLMLLACGFTLKEIACKSNKKYENIKKRTQNLYKKFHASNRKELITVAIRENLIKLSDIKPRFRKRFVKLKKIEKILPDSPKLENKEIVYLRFAAYGKTQAEIIQAMGLSGLYPAQEIKAKICGKLNCKNITEAVYIAGKLEII